MLSSINGRYMYLKTLLQNFFDRVAYIRAFSHRLRTDHTFSAPLRLTLYFTTLLRNMYGTFWMLCRGNVVKYKVERNRTYRKCAVCTEPVRKALIKPMMTCARSAVLYMSIDTDLWWRVSFASQ